MKPKTFVALFYLLSCAGLNAQNITVRVGENTLFGHSEIQGKIVSDRLKYVPSLDVRFGLEDNSGYFSHDKGFEYGIGLCSSSFGDLYPVEGTLGIGNLYSVYPYLSRSFIACGNFKFGYSIGLGLGIVPTRLGTDGNWYNEFSSIPVNAYAHIGLEARYDIKDKYELGTTLYINHASNGGISHPNRGLNSVGVGLFVSKVDSKYAVERQTARSEHFYAKRPRLKPYFHCDLAVAGGLVSSKAYHVRMRDDYHIYVNKIFPKWSIEGDVMFRYCNVLSTGVVLDLFGTSFYKLNAEARREGEKFDPLSYGIALRQEFHYKAISASYSYGFYFHHNDGVSVGDMTYQMVAFRWYIPDTKLFLGAYLKTHVMNVAESVQFGLGLIL